jgi:hypothetical protein
MADIDDILSGKSEEPTPETTPEPVAVEAAPAEATEPDETETTSPDGQKMVPQAALHAQKEKVKRYTEEVVDFRKTVEESNARIERLIAQFAQQQQPKPEPTPAPDWFENPNAAAMHAFTPHLEQMQQTLLANAKLIAGTKYTDEKVDAAEKAFMQAVESRSLDPADYHKVVNSPNRYAAAVQWFARQQAQQEIGDDPAAFKEKLRAQILEELKAEQPAAPTGNGAVMPSNLANARNVGVRSGPAWGGPTPLNDIFKR